MEEEQMKYFRSFLTLAAFVLLASTFSVFAEDSSGPTVLSQEEKDAINKKNIGGGFDISISPSDKQELKEDTAVRACQLIIPKLGVKSTCCEDPKCREDVQNNRPVAKKYQVKKPKLTFEQQVKKDCIGMGGGSACENFDSARNYVNQRLCYKYGGDDETCQDPTKSREFVLNCRNGACRSPIAEASAQKKVEPLDEGAPGLASSPPPPMYPPPPAGISGHEPLAIPPPGRTYGGKSASFYYGAEFMGFAGGPMGPSAVLRMTPVEYFDLGASVGYAYVKNQRMSDHNMQALNAGSFGADAILQYPFSGRYAIGVGPSWNLVAQLGASKPLIVQTVGGVARLSMSRLFGSNGRGYFSFYLGNSLGPKNGIMSSGGAAGWAIGLLY